MPELPEVETVKETLKKKVLNRKIIDCNIFYNNTIEHPKIDLFKEKIINQTINDIKRQGKWLIFELDDYFLLSHLRMEGKYFIKEKGTLVSKHEHVSFIFSDFELRYQDTRKFGKIHLYSKNDLNKSPLSKLGPEPFTTTLSYLKEKYKNKKLPIKTVLLDQNIMTGIGNIYADEILFISNINPLKKTCDLSDSEVEKIIANSIIVLNNAIKQGGTTIRSYTSSDGVTGRFQNDLFVHTKEGECCKVCQNEIIKIKIGGRGTYYCPICQNGGGSL